MREYDLLAGMLACQLRLLSQGTLVHFASALAEDPDLSLLDYLLDSKALCKPDQQLLCRLVDTIIHAHHGDEKAALKAFGGNEAASVAFAGSIVLTEQGWGPSEDRTVLSAQLPHGLPPQITPETLGRYTRGSEYARGGIGRILLVHDEQIGRDIILKELLPQPAVSPTDSTLSRMPQAQSPGSPMRQSAAMMARFLQEAKITGQLEHPSIVPVYELGTRRDGQLYYTMKLVRGDTLAEAIKSCMHADDRLALLRAFLDVCQAMAYAHSRGVIHRDLKPSNIMVGEFGECVVLDWGLAKMNMDEDAHREALEKTISQFKLGDDQLAGLKTRSKDVLGTPLYMAPEQARGEVDAVGVQSDVYSLGVILYEILSGNLPHPWTNSMDTIRRVGTTPAPPLRKVAPHTPPELAAICDKALAFHTKNRYASARDLANDIQRFLEGAVVDAYAYKVTDILRRLYRRHRTLIHVTSAATAVILIMGVISYINIYNARLAEMDARIIAEKEREEADRQRTAAEEAEERTAREKYISNIRLADAYIRDYKFQAAEDTLLATDPAYRSIEWGMLVARCNQDLATLRGHTNVVFKSFFSPDGKTIVTVSGDNSARLWSAENYAMLYEWRYPQVWLRHAAFDATGSRLALCLSDGSVRMVDPASGNELYALTGHTAPVNFCAFNAAGDQLLTASSDRTAKRWDLATQAAVVTLEDHRGEIKAAAFCDAGRKVYTVTANERIRLFTLEGKPLAEAPGMGVNAPGAGAVLVARQGNAAFVYKGSDLTEVLRLPHEDTVERVTCYPEHEVVVTACADGIARVWRLTDGTLQQVFNVRHPLKDCKISPDGRLLAAMAVNGLTVVWERASAREVTRFSGHREATAAMEFHPDGQRLLTCSMDRTARLWLTEHAPTSRTVARTAPGLMQMSIARDSKRAALASREGHCVVQNLDSETPAYTATFQQQPGGLKLALAPGGSSIVIVPDEFLPLLVSLPDGSVLRRLEGHEGYVSSVNYSPDGALIATTSWDDTTRLWDGATGEARGTLSGHTDTVYHAAFSPGGNYIATASHDQTAIIWDRARQEPLFTIKHEARVVQTAFSHDDQLVATASGDGTVQVWQLSTRARRFNLSGQMYDVDAVAFSADDKRLLSVSSDNTVRLWDLDRGEALIDIPIGSERAATADFGLSPAALLVALQSGELRELSGVPLDPANSIVEPAALEERVAAYKSARLEALMRPPAAQAAARIDRIIPQPQATQGLEALVTLASATPAGQAIQLTSEAEARCWPLGLRAGDTLLNINGNTAAAYPAYVPTLTGATLEPNGARFYIDAVRDSMPLRLSITMLPLTTETRTVTLPQAQARALLQQALAMLQGNTEAILQVNKRWAEYARMPLAEPDSVAGLWINAPGDLFGKKMLQAAGLRAGERIIELQGIAVGTLNAITLSAQRGAELPLAPGSFDRLARLSRGQFGEYYLSVHLK